MHQPGPGYQPATVCVRHPDRPTALACQRCGRPACPDCLREAAVGYQCVDCVRAGRRDVRQVRTRPTPIATYALIAVNTLVFAITAAQAKSLFDNDLGSGLFDMLELRPLAVADGQLIRVLGAGFLHFGPIHLVVNMLALYIVGRDVELVLGRSRYLAVYLVSILGGSAAVMALQPVNTATAGASGAIFGLFGAQVVILLRLRQSPGPVLMVIAINVIISVSLPGISLWGHLGGLAAGTAASAGLLFAPGVRERGIADPAVRAIGWGAVAAVGLLAIVIVLVRITQLR